MISWRPKPRVPILARCALAAVAVILGATGCASDASRADGAADKSEGALLRAGDSALAAGDLGTAVGLYRQAATIAPKDFSPYDRLGRAFARAGDYPDAAAAYRQGVSLAPDNADENRKLGAVTLALGKPELAIGYFDAARRNGDDPRIWNGLGVANDSLGQHGLAQEDYRAGLKLAPGDLSLRNNYGLSQALSGDYPAAIATLTAVAADPHATARHRQNLALAYGLAGDNVKASIAARTDLSDDEIVSNQRYYALLRAMDDRARTQAIFGDEYGRPSAAPVAAQ